MLRRMTAQDRIGFDGLNDLPSGPPLVAEAVPLPGSDGSDTSLDTVTVLVGCSETAFIVEIIIPEPVDSPLSFNASREFDCERDAVAFGELVASGRLSLSALEELFQ